MDAKNAQIQKLKGEIKNENAQKLKLKKRMIRNMTVGKKAKRKDQMN